MSGLTLKLGFFGVRNDQWQHYEILDDVWMRGNLKILVMLIRCYQLENFGIGTKLITQREHIQNFFFQKSQTLVMVPYFA